MKFKTKASLLLACIVLLCMISIYSGFRSKTKSRSRSHSKRAGSSMEFLNNFFSPDEKQVKVHNDIENNDSEEIHSYRFKERSRTPSLTQQLNTRNERDEDVIKRERSKSSRRLQTNITEIVQRATSEDGEGKDGKHSLEAWFQISSPQFADENKYPKIKLPDGKVVHMSYDQYYFRKNLAFKHMKDDKPADERYFFFRLLDEHIFYSSTKTDFFTLAAFDIPQLTNLRIEEKIPDDTKAGHWIYCFSIDNDHDPMTWKMCTKDKPTYLLWLCVLKAIIKKENPKCKDLDPEADNDEPITQDVQTIEQPIVIIPLPSRQCNANWTYQKNGRDWECDCSEGKEQAPIDLPYVEEAIDSPVKPLFQYEEVSATTTSSTLDGQIVEHSALKLILDQGLIKIMHNKFGKVVTVDGSVYYAEEIIIHTPSEHTISGKGFPVELQIIHYGQSKGDIGKQIILSFLFEKVPGIYNRFLDDLDLFNLPTPIAKTRDITQNIFIPKIFFNSDDDEMPVMKNFSFYTYQGSLTAPPCSENTIIYVASKPLKLGTTAIQLLQESLRMPDMMNDKGEIIVSDFIPKNARAVQPLQGRPVFHFDHEKYCGPDPPIPESKRSLGHYEKYNKAATKYFYVNGQEASGLPNAFVVSEKEAMGTQ